MDLKVIQRVHNVTASITITAILFYLFFQVNKGGPFRDLNPFAVDPYDAVGSFAIQIAILIGILTYARALRLWDDPAQAIKAQLILRGNGLVLLVVLITLITDVVAEIVRPFPPSYWGNVILVELALMFLLASVCALALVATVRRIQTAAPPPDLTPADGIDDLWTLVRVPVARSCAILPRRIVEWVKCFNSDRLFARLSWLNPRTHPWRFACALGLLVGAGLVLAQLQEGLPPSLMIGLLVTGIFISAELAATLLVYALLGGYPGLRPAFIKNRI
jgi:hypothetical protein